jgi:hypothetical protein
MYMETSVAKQLSDELNDIIGRLDESVRLVMDRCSKAEFTAYRSVIGRVMGMLVLDVLNPLYASNPESSRRAIVPFRCAKTGSELSPGRAGHCALCERLLDRQFLPECVYLAQRKPVCVDCIQAVADKTFAAIIKRDLWLVDAAAAARRKDIRIEIGFPRPTGSGEEAACSVLIRGLMPNAIDIHGSDALSAMQCAMTFAESELKVLPETMAVQWPGGEAYFDQP